MVLARRRAWAYPRGSMADWLASLPATPVPGGVLAGVAVAAVVALVVVTWALGVRLRHARAAAERAWAVLDSGVDAYFLWPRPSGPAVCSRRLAVLLGLPRGTDSTWYDLRDAFADADAAALDEAAAGLWRDGAGFELVLPTLDGDRRVQLAGGRAARADGTPLADVLWVRDVTEAATESQRLSGRLEAVAAERWRLAALLDLLPDPAWLRDPELRLTFCNEAYAVAVEAADAEEAVDRDWQITAGAPDEDDRALARRAADTGEPAEENRHVVIEGERRYLTLCEAPLDRHGHVAGYARDLTRLESAREELKRHLDAQDEVLENLSTAIAIFGPDRRLAFFNTAFQRLWRLDRDWLATQPTYGAFLDTLREERRLPEPADFPAYKADELKRFSTLLAPTEDLLHLPDDTTLRRVIAPHPVGGLVMSYEDVTDKLALERSHNTMLAVQRETLDHLWEGVALFGADGTLRLSNPAFARLWNLDADALAAEPHISDLVDRHRAFFEAGGGWAAFRDELMTLFNERLNQNGRVGRDDGSVLAYTSVPLPDGAMLLSYMDVTDTARVEDALNERNQALAMANRLKADFLAGVAHELRTPLTSVTGFAELLAAGYADDQTPERRGEYLDALLESARTLDHTVGEVLELASVEAGTFTLAPESLDVPALAAGVLALVRERARRAGVALTLDCPADTGRLEADPRRLKQALVNLLASAVTAAPRGGRVGLTVRRDGGTMAFTVRATGTGLLAESPDAAADPFGGGAGPAEGAGLGLSLVKAFIEAHGGRVESTAEGDGTTAVTCFVPGAGDPDA